MTNSEQREAARQFANTWKNGGDEIVGVRIIQLSLNMNRQAMKKQNMVQKL